MAAPDGLMAAAWASAREKGVIVINIKVNAVKKTYCKK
jgi:predicted flavoprotein YhiN